MHFTSLKDYFRLGFKQIHWFVLLQWPGFFTFLYEKTVLLGLEKEDARDMLPKLIPFLVISSVSMFLISGAFGVYFDRARKGEKLFIKEVYEIVFGQLKSVIIAAVVCGIAFCLGILAYLLPGLGLMAVYIFVPYIVVLENPPGLTAALFRSWKLTAKIPFKVGVVVVIQMVLQFAFYLFSHNFPTTLFFFALEFLLVFISGTFLNLVVTHLYFKFRSFSP